MARVKISDFGIIQKSLAQAVVTIYEANDDGSNSGVKATLYAASTGSSEVSNPQTLNDDGKLSIDVYVETDVIATITGITERTERALKKIKKNPKEYSLPQTSANFYYVSSIGIDTSAAASASAAATSASNAASSATSSANSASAAATSESNAATSETNAAVSASAAATSEANAATSEANALAAVGTVKVSSNDTTSGVLEDKLLVGSGLALSTQNDGGNETRTIDIDISLLATQIGNLLFPIGSYYINETNSTNPATLLGFGTWVAVEDKMIIGASATYPAGSTGGSATTTITANESATLTYNVRGTTSGVSTAYPIAGINYTSSRGMVSDATTNTQTTDSTDYAGNPYISTNAGNNALTTISPYISAYIWKRTA